MGLGDNCGAGGAVMWLGAAGVVMERGDGSGAEGAAGAVLGPGSHKPEQTPLSPSLYSPPQAAAAVGAGPT